MRKRIDLDLRHLSLVYLCGDGARGLSKNAELIARRVIDLLIRSDDHKLPNDFRKIQNAIGGGLSPLEFSRASREIRDPDFGIFDVTEDKKWLYSKRLLEYFEHRANVSAQRRQAGRKGGKAKAASSAIKKEAPRASQAVAVKRRKSVAPVKESGPESAADVKWDLWDQICEENRKLNNPNK